MAVVHPEVLAKNFLELNNAFWCILMALLQILSRRQIDIFRVF